MNKLVSAIVPVYNGEKYIEGCIESLLNQTYRDIEVIVVDDGSIDDTAMICQKYMNNKGFVYHKKSNQGVSVARNVGKELAKGEYIIFVDADDEAMPQMIERLVSAIEANEADISVCGVQWVNEDGSILKENKSIDALIDNKEAIRYLLNGEELERGVWNKLFKKECIQNVEFCVGRRMNEDIFFVFQAFFQAKKVEVISIPLYKYYVRIGSVTRRGFTDAWFDNIFFAKRIYDEVKDGLVELEAYARMYMVRSEYFVLKVMCRYSATRTYREDYKKIKSDIKSSNLNGVRSMLPKSVFLNLMLIKWCFPIWRCLIILKTKEGK